MIIDDITDCLIQRTLDDGGEVWAFNATDKFKVISAGDNQVTIESQGYKFGVGDKLSFLYLPKYSTPYCNHYKDTDGDGIIDLVDLDKDGDGVIDPRAPFRPTFVYVLEILPTIAPSQVTIAISPNPVLVTKAREWGKPLVIDGYYPLYISQGEALWASPLAEPLAHPHDMSEEHDGVNYQWEYWMPHGVNQWHGNYTNCPPDDLFEVFASSVETYDFEYVDRVAGRSFFASIIPYDYTNRILGIDRDENGTYESTQSYFLENMYNSQDTFNESGELVSNGDFKWSHYSTNPRQAWTFEVTSKASSEDTLPDGHSFQMGNYVYHIRTYSKFSPDTEDARKHTLSWAIYHSKLTNGSNAEFSAQSGGVVVYNQTNGNGGDYWAKKAPLEINSDGFIVMDDDMFSEGDRFYIIEQYVPEAPSIVEAEGPTLPDAIAFVNAQLYIVKPKSLRIVNASILDVPLTPSVSANIYAQEQEIEWDQFESGSTTGELPIVEVEEEEEKAVLLPVNRIVSGEPSYDLKTLSGTANFIRTSPFKTISPAAMAWGYYSPGWGGSRPFYGGDSNMQGWYEQNPASTYAFPVPQDLPTYITQEIYLQKQVVSQGLYKEIMGNANCALNSSYEGDNLPAHNINYNSALQFCRLLNRSQRARGNLPEGWIYMLPSPLVLNRYLGQDFAGTSYYMPFGARSTSSRADRLSKAPDMGISGWEGEANVLPLQEITEESRKDVFDSILHAPFGTNHVDVNTGYENRYGFINPFGSVETFTSVGDNMNFLKRGWHTQNEVFNRRVFIKGSLQWDEHPSRVAHWNYRYNVGGTHAWADTEKYSAKNSAVDPVNSAPTYHGTWGLARNVQLRASQNDPNYGDVIHVRNTSLRCNIGDNNQVETGRDETGNYRQYYPTMTQQGWVNLIGHNVYYFPDTYDIPSGYTSIGTAEDIDLNHYNNMYDNNLSQYHVKPKAGIRLMLVNTKSGYLHDTSKDVNEHQLLYKYYN